MATKRASPAKTARRPAKRTAPRAGAAKKKPRSATGPAEKHYRRDGSLESVGRNVNGKKEGPWKFYHHDGKTLKASGRYEADLFTGLWKWYAANGALRQWGRFEKGEQEGLWKRWYGGTARLCDVGRYEKGKRTGEWKFYAKDGKLRGRGNSHPMLDSPPCNVRGEGCFTSQEEICVSLAHLMGFRDEAAEETHLTTCNSILASSRGGNLWLHRPTPPFAGPRSGR